jgi:hypothetical protein
MNKCPNCDSELEDKDKYTMRYVCGSIYNTEHSDYMPWKTDACIVIKKLRAELADKKIQSNTHLPSFADYVSNICSTLRNYGFPHFADVVRNMGDNLEGIRKYCEVREVIVSKQLTELRCKGPPHHTDLVAAELNEITRFLWFVQETTLS